MRTLTGIRTAVDAIPVATGQIVGATDDLKRGVRVATIAIVLAVVLSSIAIVVAVAPRD